MKKIFAIALALVMVLSMTSAFAGVGTCGLVDAFSCPTVGCGVAKAEVVHFVADNSADGFSENACAAVVKDQKIFWGIKVTFDADVNEQWYTDGATTLEVSVSNTVNAATKNYGTLANLTGKTYDAVGTKSFWLTKAGKLVGAFDPTTCVFEDVAQNTRVEVCANVKYDFDGVGFINYGSFTVNVATGTDYDYDITVTKSGDSIVVYVVNGVAKYVEYDGDLYYASKGNVLVAKNGGWNAATKQFEGEFSGLAGLACSDVDELMALINIDFGDCVNKSVIKKIFGWANGDAVCATWNKDAVAIVDANCVLSIPKTGDVSVVAYAVMAVVAAAGTMLKK